MICIHNTSLFNVIVRITGRLRYICSSSPTIPDFGFALPYSRYFFGLDVILFLNEDSPVGEIFFHFGFGVGKGVLSDRLSESVLQF